MIKSYFESEKKAAFIALAIGLAACSVASAIMISARPAFYMGLALALLSIGILQIIVGTTVARRSDFQALDLQKLLSDAPADFVAVELPRMEKVMRSFKWYKWVEIVLLILSLALIGLNQEAGFSKGLGIGLLIQSLIMLAFDFYAEKRGREYSSFVDQTSAKL